MVYFELVLYRLPYESAVKTSTGSGKEERVDRAAAKIWIPFSGPLAENRYKRRSTAQQTKAAGDDTEVDVH